MNNSPILSTLYLEPALHQALRLKAARTHRSMSEIVNDAVRAVLREDAEDLAAFAKRAQEKTLAYGPSPMKTSWRGSKPMARYEPRFKISLAKYLRDISERTCGSSRLLTGARYTASHDPAAKRFYSAHHHYFLL